MKTLKKFIKIAVVLATLALICGSCFYFNYFTKNIHASSDASNIIFNSDKPLVKKINTYLDSPTNELIDVKFHYLNNELNFTLPLLHKMNRYYLPIEEFMSFINGTYTKSGDNINLTLNNITVDINTTTNTFVVNNISKPLRGHTINYASNQYLSINDIEYIFSLRSIWDLENNSINLLKYDRPTQQDTPSLNDSSEIAVIRIEDVSAGDVMLESDSLEKFKTFIDYMYENNIKFNMGWIPRFVNPPSNTDNNLLENFNISNACFINFLDYCINMNGRIGLHGYTHQSGNEASIIGVDLDPTTNNDDHETRHIIESSISTAEMLNIPITFFESAHYRASMQQRKIVSEYFKYAYEPYSPVFYNIPFVKNDTLFVPAPLGYVPDQDISNITNRLKKKPEGMLASFFYHPAKEFRFIDSIVDNDTVKYSYSDESPMHRISTVLKENNYTTFYVDSL